ncbi:MAG: coenzyme F420-0:L-glutamate ligase [Candidatus Thorarchaeota archaeon]
MTANRIEVFAIDGVPRIDGPVELSRILLEALDSSGVKLQDRDVVIIAHTLVSKAEGRIVHREDVEISRKAQEIAKRGRFDPAQVELAIRESAEIITTDRALITVTKTGLVCNFSGVDHSNAPENSFVLLPENPDESAFRLREELVAGTGKNIAVIVSDTEGRPWRKGAVNLAIGCSGINAFKYNKGKQDLYGRRLQHSMICQVDQLAATAEAVMGQAAEGRPFVIIRGYEYENGLESCKDIQRSKGEDMFR